MASHTLTIQHPETGVDVEIEVEFTITPAEHDVGIMSEGIEDEVVLEPNQELNLILKESDWDKIRTKIYNEFDFTPDHDYDYED